MQFLSIDKDTSLSTLSDIVGDRNVESILFTNNLKRIHNVGKAFSSMCSKTIEETSDIDSQRKMTLLNTVTDTADVFEAVSLLDNTGWRLFSTLGTLPSMLKIPETITLPMTVDMLGREGHGISTIIYKKVMDCLRESRVIDPSIFNEYSLTKQTRIINNRSVSVADPFQWFKIPWGEVTLYSSLGNDSKDFPVYPEEISDSYAANYTQMPDMLYQYEPWQVYQSSGPRTNTYTFKFHRDMWSGDHKDGRANELIRFCEANCYPEYNGSAVNTATVTLYIAGKPLITGVLTSVVPRWSGPLGHDGFYLYCELEITITEVSETKLDYSTVRNKSLIG